MKVVLPFLIFVGMGLAHPVLANEQLAQSKNCLACHAIDQKKVGPAYKEVAKKYAKQKDAEIYLAKKIREGSTGVWGQIPMPANVNVNAQEAQTLAKWVLSLK